MKKQRILAFATALCLGLFSGAWGLPARAAGGAIEIDGASGDWDRAGILPVVLPTADGTNGVDVTVFRGAKDPAGNVYLCFEGAIPSGEAGDLNGMEMEINGQYTPMDALLKDERIPSVCYYDPAQPEPPFVLEMEIPAELFPGDEDTFSFGGASFRVAMLPLLEEGASDGGEEAPVYTGITIDGVFDDWAGVNKTADTGVNGEGVRCLEEVALVFEGDYVYLYLKEAVTDGALMAGPQSKGRYHILTDLGNALAFQLHRDGTVSGVEGAEARHVGSRWEVSIPAKALPAYNETLSFGPEPEAPLLSDVANSGAGVAALGPARLALAANDVGIVIDGSFGDWSDYPHMEISGANKKITGDASLCMTEDSLLVHVKTKGKGFSSMTVSQLLGSAKFSVNGAKGGGEQTISLAVVTANGQSLDSLEKGADYTLYIYDAATGHPDNPAEIIANALGVMKIHIGKGSDPHELEVGIELEKAAALLGVDFADIKTAELQLPGLGNQWVEISGISTGPWLGVVLCLTVAGSVAVLGKRKKGKDV